MKEFSGIWRQLSISVNESNTLGRKNIFSFTVAAAFRVVSARRLPEELLAARLSGQGRPRRARVRRGEAPARG